MREYHRLHPKEVDWYDLQENNPELYDLIFGSMNKWKEFDDIHTPSCTNEAIKRWVLRAGIEKEITFHCGRHTFAVLMLDIGTDIYTVSKLLGHRELNTTQIYAKVLDKNKQAAVAKIPSILPTSEEGSEEETGK